VRIDNQDNSKIRKSNLPKTRKEDIRKPRQYFLIVCEGEKTEPNYFKSFKKFLPPNMMIIHGEGRNTLSLIDEAEKLFKDYNFSGNIIDEIWVVFDRDSFNADNFDNAIHRANNLRFHCAYSNEAFELWYILHFEYKQNAASRDDYKSILTKYLNFDYKKNDPGMYYNLKDTGNQEQAIKWAKKLLRDHNSKNIPPSKANPCTTVFALVERLNEFIEIKQINDF